MNIADILIKNSYDYVLQSDVDSGKIYRIGGGIPVNPTFGSGLTVNGKFTYVDGTEQPNYVLTSDAYGVGTWKPISGALSGTSGTSGTSGESGTSGTSGTSGLSGTSGENGTSGTSGSSGINGTSGTSGTSFHGINNAGGNRIITSNGSPDTVDAESNLTFDGTTLDLHLGNINNVNTIKFNTNPIGITPTGGTVYYDYVSNSLTYKPITPNNDVSVNLGQESLIKVFNNTGTLITNGTAVHITGSTGSYPSVTRAVASDDTNTFYQVNGVATHDIPHNTYGFVTYFGLVNNLDLSAFNVGDQLYLSQTEPGKFIKESQLSFTGRTCEIGHVINNGVNGSLLVEILNEQQYTNITLLEQNILNANNASTGVFTFGGIQKTSNTTFSVGAAKGLIVNNTTNPTKPTIKYVNYPGGSGLDSPYRTTNTITYILLTSGGTLSYQPTVPTPQQRRQNIYLGKIGHPDKATYSIAFQVVDYINSPISQLRDMFIPFPLINNGVTVYPNDADLKINNTAGTLHGLGIAFPTSNLNPNTIAIPAITTGTSFQYRTQTGGTTTATQFIVPGQWDNGGKLQAIGSPAKQATNQRIFLLQDGSFRIQYGQVVHSDLDTAISKATTESFVTFPNFKDNGILIGILSLRSDTTNLSDTSFARFISASKIGEISAAGGGVSGTSGTSGISGTSGTSGINGTSGTSGSSGSSGTSGTSGENGTSGTSGTTPDMTNAKLGSFGIVIDNTPNTITTGFKGSVTMPYAGSITSWTVIGDQNGSIAVDIYKTTYDGYPGSVANSITGGNNITLTNQSKNTSPTLTGWTTTFSAGDIMQFNVDSVATVNKVTITVLTNKT